MIQWLSKFWGDRSGQFGLIAGLCLPVLIGASALAFDYTAMSNLRGKMQAAADQGSLNAAKELTIANADKTKVAAAARNYATDYLAPYGEGFEIQAEVVNKLTGVEVTIRKWVEPFLGGVLQKSPTLIEVRSHARASNGLPICVIGLDESAVATLRLDKSASLTAEGCGVYSNSSHRNGVQSKDSALLKAGLICSAGGYSGATSNFYPSPMTDCPSLKDPLSSRPAPGAGGCNAFDLVIQTIPVVLLPGTYCGGLKVTRGARVTMMPGIYVIKDGPLRVDGGGKISGSNVGIFLAGDGAVLDLKADSSISLTAPKSGTLAGFLVFEDRGAPVDRAHKISSDDARTLLGTIYLPRGRLVVDASKPVADESAYTVIVARKIELGGGPNLVLNSDYKATDIPVPKGVGPIGGKISLTY